MVSKWCQMVSQPSIARGRKGPPLQTQTKHKATPAKSQETNQLGTPRLENKKQGRQERDRRRKGVFVFSGFPWFQSGDKSIAQLSTARGRKGPPLQKCVLFTCCFIMWQNGRMAVWLKFWELPSSSPRIHVRSPYPGIALRHRKRLCGAAAL